MLFQIHLILDDVEKMKIIVERLEFLDEKHIVFSKNNKIVVFDIDSMKTTKVLQGIHCSDCSTVQITKKSKGG